MWNEIRRYIRTYSSAVVTGLDSDGYPVSVRCKPELDEARQALRLRISPSVPMEPGPASLLCHSHNLFLWKLRSFLVRGSIEGPESELDPGVWLFRPRRFVPGIGVDGIPGIVRFATTKRRVARRYLEQRGLSRPPIPWDAITALKADARRERAPQVRRG